MVDDLREEQNKLVTWSLVVLAAAAIAGALFLTQKVMIPFVLALIVASMVSPVVDVQVARLRMPRWAAVTTAMLLVLGMVAIFCAVMVVGAQSILSTAGQYSDDLTQLTATLMDQLYELGVTIDKDEIVNEIQTNLPAATTKIIGSVTSWVSSGGLVLVFSVFLLAGRSASTPKSGIYLDIDLKVRKYLAIKVVISAITGFVVWVLLVLMGLKSAFVFGILTFLLNFIPSVGSFVATLLPLPVAIAQSTDLGWILLVVALPGAVQITMGNIIEPKLQGEGLKLHPVVILLSLALWGLLWGIPGMVLAVPITAVLRIVFLQLETTRPIGNLLAGELPESKI